MKINYSAELRAPRQLSLYFLTGMLLFVENDSLVAFAQEPQGQLPSSEVGSLKEGGG